METAAYKRAKRWLGFAIFGVLAFFAWSLFAFHVTEFDGPVSVARAESVVGLKLPTEARNVHVASYEQWIEFAQYVRFDAPTDVCLRYASTVVPNAATKPADDFDLAVAARTLRPNAFRNFSWFDLNKGSDVITAGGGSNAPQVWVDRQRGVFYYCKTD